MISWILQSSVAHPYLARGLPPDGLLSASELRRFESLRTEKRRHDWLLGRWAAKQLVRSYIEQRTNTCVPLNEIVVESDPDGAPRLVLDLIGAREQAGRFGEAASPSKKPSSTTGSRLHQGINLQSLISHLGLSISHSRGLALCAITDEPGVAIGADIETIEPRAAGFAEDYFTPQELEHLRAVAPNERDAALTLIWSAKEAALKALRVGLTVDTRAVSCALGYPEWPETAWAQLTVRGDARLLGRQVDGISGWWQVRNAFALTIVVKHMEVHPNGHGRLYPQAA